jgi:outer membrane lipoprotein-sorting protein
MIGDQRQVMIGSARIAFVGIVLLVGQCRCAAQAVSALSGEQVLENVGRAFAGIEDYTVTLDVSADLERLNVPQMQATMYFKQPDKVHFVTDGFALLPREGMALTLGRMRSKYAVESTKEEMLDGSRVILLRLRPRAESLRLQELLLYVDPVRWTVVRGHLRLPEARAMTTTFEYERVEDRWLPSKMTVLFSAAPIDTASMNLFEQIAPTRRPQLPRSGTVTVRYSNYRINTGLSDDIFESAAKDDRD